MTNPYSPAVLADIERLAGKMREQLGLSPDDANRAAALAQATIGAELADMRRLFDMQWKRMQEATARWRAEDPKTRALVMPDLGDLLKWLMDDADRARDQAHEKDRADLPKAWRDLIDGLHLLARGQNNDISPFHCEHDRLTVMADPADFTDDEIAQLDALGFTADHDTATFYSFRFGSA